MNALLIGNPNSGKSTLFNALTGLRQHVGNFPGVTVEQHSGKLKDLPGCTVIDLPGAYSLTALSKEEAVLRDVLTTQQPDVIINIVDATCLSRSLYMTLQLLELDVPIVIALNMMDEVQKAGGRIDHLKLSEILGVPALPISASRREGIGSLIETVSSLAGEGHPNGNAPKLIKTSSFDVDERRIAERYARIDRMVPLVAKEMHEGSARKLTEKLDAVLLHPALAFPIFFILMGFIFYAAYGPLGQALTHLFQNAVSACAGALDAALYSVNAAPWIHALCVEGIMSGLSIVLSFFPTLLILFFLLSLLEDSGYMARMAFIADRFFRRMGLSGRSFVPALLGFGCSVPAILSTRTLSSRRDRYLTTLLAPFLSCSAKLPIYALFAKAFWGSSSPFVIMGLYFLGAVVGFLMTWILSRTLIQSSSSPFLLELPAYRLPTPHSALMLVRTRTAIYLKNALTTLLFASVVVWSLQRVDFSLKPVADSASSILAGIGQAISPLFIPLGFGDWRAATSLITGLLSKEGVLSTMGILLSAPTADALHTSLQGVFTPLSALSFLIFVLLYMPCMATFAASRRELGGVRYALLNALYHTGIAWLAACVVYQVGTLFL